MPEETIQTKSSPSSSDNDLVAKKNKAMKLVFETTKLQLDIIKKVVKMKMMYTIRKDDKKQLAYIKKQLNKM